MAESKQSASDEAASGVHQDGITQVEDPTTASKGDTAPTGTAESGETSGPYNTVDGSANIADGTTTSTAVQDVAFPDQPEVITSDPKGPKQKSVTVQSTASDQDGGNVIEHEVLDPPVQPAFTVQKFADGSIKLQQFGWIGPEGVTATADQIKELKALVAKL